MGIVLTGFALFKKKMHGLCVRCLWFFGCRVGLTYSHCWPDPDLAVLTLFRCNTKTKSNKGAKVKQGIIDYKRYAVCLFTCWCYLFTGVSWMKFWKSSRFFLTSSSWSSFLFCPKQKRTDWVCLLLLCIICGQCLMPCKLWRVTWGWSYTVCWH